MAAAEGQLRGEWEHLRDSSEMGKRGWVVQFTHPLPQELFLIVHLSFVSAQLAYVQQNQVWNKMLAFTNC